MVAPADAALAAALLPKGGDDARTLLLELTRVHPLLHIGVGLLVFAAQTALLSGAALLAAACAPLALRADARADSLFLTAPDPLLGGGLPLRLGLFALNVLTVAVAAALLDAHYGRCAVKPRLRPTMHIAALAGAAALGWSTLLARAAPGGHALELGTTLCTAAYSILVRRNFCCIALRCPPAAPR